jgi:hypothetical protein
MAKGPKGDRQPPTSPKEAGTATQVGQQLANFGFALAGLQTALNRNSEGETAVSTNMQRLVGALAALKNTTKAQAQDFKAVEKGGALYRDSFEQQLDESIKLRKQIGFGVNVNEAYNMNLTANRLGLNTNTDAIMKLMRISAVTGEQFGEMAMPLMALTAGNLKQNKFVGKLIHATNFAAQAFNRSTTEIITALSKLTETTLDLVNLGYMDPQFMEDVGFLRGIANLEANATKQTKLIERVLTDPHQAAVLGVTDLANKVVAGSDKLDALRLMVAMGKGADKLRLKGAARGVATNAILIGLNKDMNVMAIATQRNQLITDMRLKLEKAGIKTANMNSEQLILATDNLALKQAKANESFKNTLDVFKKQFAAPIMDETAKIGAAMKGIVSGGIGGMLSRFFTMVTGFWAGVIGVLSGISQWFGTNETEKHLANLEKDAFLFHKDMKATMAERDKTEAERLRLEKERSQDPIENIFQSVREDTKIEIRQRSMIIKGLDELLRATKDGNAKRGEGDIIVFPPEGTTSTGLRLGG